MYISCATGILCTSAITGLLSTSMMIASGSSAQAQPRTKTNETVRLDTIVIKGKKLKSGDAANTPLATETNAEDMEKKQVRTIEEFGRAFDPGVNYSRSANSVNIRGLEGHRIITTIDGIPVPYLRDPARQSSGASNTFDFFSLGGISVIKGADSSRLGGGGLGGGLLLRTLEPHDLIGPDKDWGAKVGAGFDSMDQSWFGGLAVAKQVEDTSVLFMGSYKRGDERKTNGDIDTYGPTRTKANPSDYDQSNLMFKIRQQTQTGHILGLTAERYRFDRDTDLQQAQTANGNYRPGQHSSGEQNERDRISFDYDYQAPEAGGWVDAASAKLYWQSQRLETSQDSWRYISVPGKYTRQNEVEEKGVGFTGFIDSRFSSTFADHTVTLGTDMFFGKAEQYSAGKDSCPANPPYPRPWANCGILHTNRSDMPDVDTRKFSLYAQDRMNFGDSGFSLTPGIRFDWYEYKPKPTSDWKSSRPFPQKSDDTAISPKLLAEYEVNNELLFYAQWAMAYRAPSANELYFTFEAPSTYIIMGNPELKPEKSNGFDIGTRFGDESFGGRVSAFYNRYRNFIDQRNLTSAELAKLGIRPGEYMFINQHLNIARAKIYGIEASAHKRFDSGINLRAGFAYTRGENEQTGQYLASVAPLKGIVGVGYDAETWGIEALFTGVKGVSDKSSATFKAPGYGIVDLTAWWEPEQIKGFRLQAGVYNLFDRTYWDALANKDKTVPISSKNYFSDPGRTFRISMTQSF